MNDTIKAFCTRLAQFGFAAFAPDLYHGELADTIAGAEALGRALDGNFPQAKAEIAQAVLSLIERAGKPERGLAVIGFSLGVYYALDLAAAAALLLVSLFLGAYSVRHKIALFRD